MAYLKEIVWKFCPCGMPATVELVNNRNEDMGGYCRKCGERELAALKDSESRL